MEIRIYDPLSLELQAILTRATSVQWTRRHYDVGSFELHFPRTAPYLSYLTDGAIVQCGANSGIVRYVEETEERAGGDVKVMGHTLQGLCADRIVVPPFYYMEGDIDPLYSYDRVKGNGESVMKHYVAGHLVTPTDPDRKILHLAVAANQGRGKESVAWQAKFQRVSDVLLELGQYAGLGWDITLDAAGKAFTFDVSPGTDRTTGQTSVAPLVFGRSFRNIGSATYTKDALSAINTAYVAGSGEEEEQFVAKVGGGIGILRREGTTDIGSDDVEEVMDGGNAYLTENALSETIEAASNGKPVYREDWDLGDTVTLCVSICGETLLMDKQITEVREVYERGMRQIEPVFGEQKESVLKRLKRGKA